MALKTYKQRVAKVLEKYENARNDDKTLYAYYIYEYASEFIRKDYEGHEYVRLRDMKHLPSTESVRRARQIIQNDDGKFLPTKESVKKGRGTKEKNWRDAEVREAKQLDIYEMEANTSS